MLERGLGARHRAQVPSLPAAKRSLAIGEALWQDLLASSRRAHAERELAQSANDPS